MSAPDEGAARLSAITPRRAPQPKDRRSERKAIPGRPFGRIEPTILDQDMTRADLIWVLENLSFSRDVFADNHRLATVTIDRGVRDFLLNAIKRHG
jgi:hypothetical protein